MVQINPQQSIISVEVRDIISARPGWVVRHGISMFFIILVLVVVSTYFIRYPDVVYANAKLTSSNPPREVKFKSENRLVKLNVKEGEPVGEGDILGIMQSTANADAILLLDSVIEAASSYLNINSYLSSAVGNMNNLGELQGGYQMFAQALQSFRQYIGSGYYIRKKAMLLEDITYFSKLYNYLEQQKNIQGKDLALTQKTYEANQRLNREKVIADFEIRAEESKYLAKQMTIPQIDAALVTNRSSIHEKRKEIAALENEIAQQKNIFIEALHTLKASIAEWKTTYLLIAPVVGKVNFSGFIQTQQLYNASQVFCYVNPGNTSYRAELNIPQANFGKIDLGQKVSLKFQSYPFQEFGALEGSLSYLSEIPSDSGFVAIADLKNRLITNYKKQIQFKEGLTATAEIVTKEKSLLGRLIEGFRSQLDK